MTDADDAFLCLERMKRITIFIRGSVPKSEDQLVFRGSEHYAILETVPGTWDMDIENIPFSISEWSSERKFFEKPVTEECGYIICANEWSCEFTVYRRFGEPRLDLTIKNEDAMVRDLLVVRMGETFPSWVWDSIEDIPWTFSPINV